jgi:hypothetical protein
LKSPTIIVELLISPIKPTNICFIDGGSVFEEKYPPGHWGSYL